MTFDFAPAEFIEEVFIYDPFRSGVNQIEVETYIAGKYVSCGRIS